MVDVAVEPATTLTVAGLAARVNAKPVVLVVKTNVTFAASGVPLVFVIPVVRVAVNVVLGANTAFGVKVAIVQGELQLT
jgi:hypothetical protein